jgi:hypothetical protein
MVKRRTDKLRGGPRRKTRLTDEMVELFKRGEQLKAAFPEEMSECEGDHSREFLAIDKRLN